MPSCLVVVVGRKEGRQETKAEEMLEDNSKRKSGILMLVIVGLRGRSGEFCNE